MTYPDELLDIITHLYFYYHDIDRSDCIVLLDSWRNFFFYHWSLLVKPVESNFFETYTLKLDYLQLLELSVPPSLEQFKRDIYTRPDLILSAMAAALHIETLCYCNRISFERTCTPTNKKSQEQIFTQENDFDVWRTDLSKIYTSCNTKNFLTNGKLMANLSFNEKMLHAIAIRLENFTPSLPFSSLRSHTVGCIASVRGHVVRIGPSKPLIISALFVCHKCERAFFKRFKGGIYDPPVYCFYKNCNSKTFEIQRHCVETTKWQNIRIQEEISSETTWKNNRPAETTANSLLDIELTGDLVGNYFPGNIVEVVGVIKASESQSDSAFSHKFLYTIYMDAVSINVLNKKYESHTSREYNNMLGIISGSSLPSGNSIRNDAWNVFPGWNDNGALEMASTASIHEGIIDDPLFSYGDSFVNGSSDENNIYFEFIRDIYYNEPNRFYLAAASMFPKVVGRNYAKAGLLLSILGGVSIYDECRALKRRGNIHCLLVGDPGVGKSLFLRSICNPLYGNYFFSGGSITASGLTAAVVRESGSNEFNLEAGALVLSSGGVCCIDELDKVSAIEQEAFLEVMEQQVVSVAKAGIISTLNARTTVICASNPINGKFNSKKSLSENIKLSQPLLSRFDLIFVMVDNPLGDHDETISNHLLKRDTHVQPQEERFKTHREAHTLGQKIEAFDSRDLLDEKLLYEYIEYGKAYVHPTFTEESKEALRNFYCELRSLSKIHTDSLPITTRQLEGIIRLCQARARGDLCDKILPDHVNDVIDIFKHTGYYPGYMSTIVPKKTPVKVSRAKSANASVSLFVSELKEILNNQTACVPNKEMLDLAKEVIEVNNLPIQPDELLNRANYYGYILKQGTFWKTNV